MSLALFLVALLAAVVAGGVIAKRLALPYPIVFVVGGVALAFVPNLPHVRLDPNLIFLIVLPPLLVNGGWRTDWFAFKRNARGIALLAVGLVLLTTVVVAFLAHHVIGIAWPMAFALGAIVAPPDAVAAEAIFERFSIPRRIVAIVTGEGLVNDATALVIYRFAIAAAVAGTFSLRLALVSFVVVAIGGIAIGILCAVAIEAVLRFLRQRELDDSTLVTAVLLVAPYASYLPAEAAHVSGVLAAVAAGITLSRRSNVIMDPESRVVGASVWNVMTFILNAFVFLAIGLQLRPMLASIRQSPIHFAADAAIICIAVIVVRMAWVYIATAVQRFSGLSRQDGDAPNWRAATLIGYCGMRGIVSLAAALALPYESATGTPLAGRAEIVVLTLSVIFVTLVAQGLTLAPLIRWLDIGETGKTQRQGTDVRIRALEAGLKRLHDLEPHFSSSLEWETAGRLLREYEDRIQHLRGHLQDDGAPEPEGSSIDHRLQREALDAERGEIQRLRAAGAIPDDVYRGIEYDLDLANLRLA